MLWMYLGFITLVLILLALDLGVFHRHAHVISVRESLGWSAFWIALGLLFSGFIYLGYNNHWAGLGLTPDIMASKPVEVEGVGLVYNNGSQATLKYITGYLVEKSLAVDNIFVIAMIFSYFAVPAMYQHRVLFWGIVGALVMRGVMIAIGVELIHRFEWIIYVFGGFLVVTGIRMLFAGESHSTPDRNPLVKLARRLMPITERYHGQHFFVRGGSAASHEPPVPGAEAETDAVADTAKAGALMATPLLLALIMIEFTDLIFAVDSIPAIFAITADPFLVFTSNVFAILGLRSLYFALAGMIDKFHYVKVALSFVLILVGVKMLTHVRLKALLGENFNLYLLAAVLTILALGIVASILRPAKKE
ncbi:MAG TPA: TerC family protein [Phycisphaerae bacterium]|nr:TerC family protein [Phycisphaerae bacterium]HOJ73105.1 TerC family protein [Phycisphaerae bacterium]HOM52721.1 TerC family protein [Phycisphaerae bacterium]HON68050.1 TerC family protein [Phycisphaerae bacterium]HOQ86327.1 TerC family protein [Phycisphaerae bacterium]